jgi:hypothetical protein
MTDIPIACSLTPDQIPARRDALIALAERSLIDARITLRRDAHTEATLDELVRAESECCPWLDLRVIRQPETLRVEYRRGRG